MKQRTTFSMLIVIGLALSMSAYCTGGQVEQAACNADLDTDSDGLDDCTERALGTAPHLLDTDGDGLSDYDEVIEYSLSDDLDTFDPLVPNTPEVRVSIVSNLDTL